MYTEHRPRSLGALVVLPSEGRRARHAITPNLWAFDGGFGSSIRVTSAKTPLSCDCRAPPCGSTFVPRERSVETTGSDTHAVVGVRDATTCMPGGSSISHHAFVCAPSCGGRRALLRVFRRDAQHGVARTSLFSTTAVRHAIVQADVMLWEPWHIAASGGGRRSFRWWATATGEGGISGRVRCRASFAAAHAARPGMVTTIPRYLGGRASREGHRRCAVSVLETAHFRFIGDGCANSPRAGKARSLVTVGNHGVAFVHAGERHTPRSPLRRYRYMSRSSVLGLRAHHAQHRCSVKLGVQKRDVRNLIEKC